MRVRNWWLVVWALLGVLAACSGSSERDNDAEPKAGADAGAGRPSGGSPGTGASGGRGGAGGAGGAVAGAGGIAAGSGGFGNVGADAGEAGVPGVGGTLPIAGTGGTAGSPSGGTGGLAPASWRCGAGFYGDGQCDCGCGIQDIDCVSDDDIDECVICNRFGSCQQYLCPGLIDRADTTGCYEPPPAWSCSDYYYADGSSCDCGCGAMDPDCEGAEGLGDCDMCALGGSCAGGDCPGSIDPEDITKCVTPEGWTCDTQSYNDGFDCDCGCGVLDPDCAGSGREHCVRCSADGSCAELDGVCSNRIDEADNTICTGPPLNWACSARFYGDGVLCHCGCGAVDPDCENSECDVCNAPGACSRRACPGMIDPDDETRCVQPEPPVGWTCDQYYYGDGFSCNCGCGVQDYDCVTTNVSECHDCSKCGNAPCPANIDPQNSAACSPPPEGWRCDVGYYRDGFQCDCGCGIIDPDCAGTTPEYCSNCPEESCTNYMCTNLEPNDNAHCRNEPPPTWTCDFEFYGDGACDCGCGVVDIDCASPAGAQCDFCDSGCSSGPCPGTINAENSAICDG